MVLESIIDPFTAKKHPVWLFFIGLLFSALSFFFAYWIFREQAGMVMVFLTVILAVPLMYATIEEEEEEDWRGESEKNLLKEHGKAIIFLSSLFFGFVIGFTLLYVLLPADIVNNIFSVQVQTINKINGATTTTGSYINSSGVFFTILMNNVKVLMFAVFFSFFFGAGAIFVLSWNASVIAAAIGNYVRNGLAQSASLLGLPGWYNYFHLIALGTLRYMVHGIFEIVGYFIGALAGGIISMGIINHGFKSQRFQNILYDAMVLILIAVVLLFVGAVVEVYFIPMMF